MKKKLLIGYISFLVIVTFLILTQVLYTRITTGSDASERRNASAIERSVQQNPEELRARSEPSSQLQNPDDPEPIIYFQNCQDMLGGSCMPKNDCTSTGGNNVGQCWDGGVATTGVCCIPPDPAVELAVQQNRSEKPFLLQEQCTRQGGSCMTGIQCGAQDGRSIGNCWDGGITSLGVCCAPRPAGPTPDPNQYILFQSCAQDYGGTCMSTEECRSRPGQVVGTCWAGGSEPQGSCCVD
ncbi:hypothetical protein KBC70_02765 [Candidatus Woesebacteria bacterium]|nr:hypothetical protein [Candidatus Woesebacteria bacterium]